MLRTRIVTGSLLAGLTLGMVFLDDRWAPWYPFLFFFFAVVGALGCWELLGLIAEERRPSRLLCHLGLQVVVAVNWIRPWHELCPQCVPWSDPWFTNRTNEPWVRRKTIFIDTLPAARY